MKITIYELLGMVKDGKASDITTNFMFDRKKYNLLAFLHEYTLDINSLNWEVEILEEEPRDIEVCGSLFTKSEYDKLAHSEEEKKIPEKLDHLIGYDIQQFDDLKEYVEITTNDLFGKINKVIDTLNQLSDYLKSKGE